MTEQAVNLLQQAAPRHLECHLFEQESPGPGRAHGIRRRISEIQK